MVSHKPDGPSTSFQADPVVASLYDKTDDYFGLVLVANWPPDLSKVNLSYEWFLHSVRKCFHEDDLAGETPSVYIYPTRFLHVTIATLYPVQKKQDGVDYSKIQKDWTQMVEAASKNSSWPREALKLRIETAQLGAKAGILLWKDITGGIQEMRNCLEQEASSRNMKIHNIPGIVHSTFLRFHNVPSKSSGEEIQTRFKVVGGMKIHSIPGIPGIVDSTFLRSPNVPSKSSGEDIQTRFQQLAIPSVKKIFEDDIFIAKSTRLVCETTPYMHIPCDDDHVFLSISSIEE
jgi:hypothetical protein